MKRWRRTVRQTLVCRFPVAIRVETETDNDKLTFVGHQSDAGSMGALLLFRFREVAFAGAHVHLWLRRRADEDAAKGAARILIIRIVLNQILRAKF